MCSSNDTLKEWRASWFPDWTIAWGSRAVTIFKIRQFCVYMFAPFYTSFLNCGKSLKGLPRWRNSKESDCQCRRRKRWGLIPGLRRSPGGGNGNPLQSSCLGNPRQRSLVGYSLWGRKESDRTEQLNTPDTPKSLKVSELQCPQL